MSKTNWVIAASLVFLLAIAGYWFFLRPKPVITTEEAIKAVTSPVTNLNVQSNPVQSKIPELNPIDKANPFKGVYRNPFQ